MDHLPIPESCKPQVHEIPYLGLAPRYDQLGFDGFPARHGWNPEELLDCEPGEVTPQRALWIESFIQEWLWFGILDEWAKACSLSIELADFIQPASSGTERKITTELLYSRYVRRLAIRSLNVDAANMGIPLDDFVNIPHDNAAGVDTLEGTTRQMVDFLLDRKSQSLPPSELLMFQATERLSQLYGKECDITYSDDNAQGAAPLDVLNLRILGCRAIRTIFGGGEQPGGSRTTHEKRKGLAKCIAQCQGVIRSIMTPKEAIVRTDITLSIQILCGTIVKIIDAILDESIAHAFSGSFNWHIFEAELVSRDWCPARVERLASPGNVALGYVASLLPSYDPERHDLCHWKKCLRRPDTVQKMQGKHRESCNGKCPHLTVDEANLIGIWQRSGIPGVRLTRGDDRSSLILDVVDCGASNFIAISHVWSHGLGNLKTELYSCQVEFLFQLVEQLRGQYLWIDTLCIPTEKTTRRLAISRLRDVYSDATKVLVIDRDLMKVGPDPVEQLLQIVGSEWQRRLWTLQEGRLARDLVIRFRDSTISMADLMSPVQRVKFSDFISNFLFQAQSQIKLQSSRDLNRDPQSLFTGIIEDLAPRSTTKSSDEPICLATLLGLPLNKYNPYPTMEDIYRDLPSLPQDVLFHNRSLLSAPGLTWAPSSFLEGGSVAFMSGTRMPSPGYLTPDGIHVVKDCLILGATFDFIQEKNQACKVYSIITSCREEFAIRTHDIDAPEGENICVEPSRTIDKPIVIWEKPYEFFAQKRENGGLGGTSKAVLASMVFERGGEVFCRFEMSLQGWHVSTETEDFHRSMIRTFGRVAESVTAESNVGKKICVG